MIDQNQRELAIQQFKQAEGREPELASYYQLHQKIFRLQDEIRDNIKGDLEMADGGALEERAHHGRPQLAFSQLPIEPEEFGELTLEISNLLLEYHKEKGEVEDLVPDDFDIFSLARERFEGPQDKAEPKFSALVADLALMPYLEWASEKIMPHLTEVNWRKCRCPVCAGEPNFAYLDKDEGVRWLICSRCRAEWRYTRLACPFCENKDPSKLKYYPAGENQIYRLYVCELCLRYLKAIDLRKTGVDNGFLAEPILTWSLDLAAREKGYR